MKGDHCLWLVLTLENHGAPASEWASFLTPQESRESNVEAEKAEGEGGKWIKSGEKETKPREEQEWLRFWKRRDRILSSKHLSLLYITDSLWITKLKNSPTSTPFLHPQHHAHSHTPTTCASNKWLFLLTTTTHHYLSKPGLNLCELI